MAETQPHSTAEAGETTPTETAESHESAGGGHLGLQPDAIFHLGPIDITNGHMAFLLISLILVGFGLYVSTTAKLVPTRAQSMVESLVLWFREKTELAFHDQKLAKKLLPLILTLFLAIFISNQFMALPFLSVLFQDHALFRVPTTHWGFTLALGLMVVITSHIIAFTISPRRHFGHFIKLEMFLKIRSLPDFLNFLLEGFLGFLEIIDEIAKVISISARLFGNIFAGEVMALVVVGISTYTSFVVPIPLYVLGIFVGLIQAVVFTLLSIQYLSRMANSVGSAHGH